jgi:hypothetical protein
LSLTLRDDRKLRVFETGYLDAYLGPRRMRMGSGEGSTMRNLPFSIIKSRLLRRARKLS